MIPTQKNLRPQAGFTLVELAIVMIIIGLLIAGVLKGQALIQNAQVTSTVAQTKAMEAATTTFRDTYNALPGDISSPTTKLPNCLVAPCAGAGNQDGRLTFAPGVVPAGENLSYFVQLNAASLLTGIAPSNAAATLTSFGVNFPAAKISGNGFGIGSTSVPPVVGDFPQELGIAITTLPPPGVYFVLTGTLAIAQSATTGQLKADQALRIDTKLDDGVPDTGEVRAFGAVGAAAGQCGTLSAAGVAGVYATLGTNAVCGLYIHSQS